VRAVTLSAMVTKATAMITQPKKNGRRLAKRATTGMDCTIAPLPPRQFTDG
jgi:hypothetical protein